MSMIGKVFKAMAKKVTNAVSTAVKNQSEVKKERTHEIINFVNGVLESSQKRSVIGIVIMGTGIGIGGSLLASSFIQVRENEV